MGANMAGIYGAQIFRSDDAPRYRRAFVIGIVVLAVGTAAATIREMDEILPSVLLKVRGILPSSISSRLDKVVLRREQAARASEVDSSTSESEDLKAPAIPPGDTVVTPVPATLGSGATNLT